MRAVVVDPSVESHLTIGQVARPEPQRAEALVRVKAFSLNLGEVRRGVTMAEAGWQPGWDLTGVVEQAAADGSGPKAGTRVVGFLPSGAWAEYAAVPTNALAALPDTVTFAQASTLPVAGLTALYALERAGSLLGRSALITGASGGVGIFACQLARLMGAEVVAAIRTPQREAAVRAVGAHQVVIGEDLEAARAYGRYHVILESVGGQSFTTALSLIAPGGLCVTFGVSSSTEVSLNIRSFYGGGGLNLYGFMLFNELGAKPASEGLARLARLIDKGQLKPLIDVEADWTQVGKVCRQLLERKITGKAVVTVE
jgi:NADPH:quinone reductase-like Zn-dependent oxidoreductase